MSKGAGRFFVVWLALVALPATALAQATYTATAGMPVRIEIVASCTISFAVPGPWRN